MSRLRLITIVNGLFYAAIGCATPFFALYLEGLGASYVQISLILTLWIAVTILVTTLYGRYSLRLGSRRRWLAVGLVVQAAGYLLLAAASRLPWAGAALPWAAGARTVEAVGGALFTTVSLAVIAEILGGSPTRGRQMGVFRGIGSITFAAGALLTGLLASRFEVAIVFVAGAVFFLAAAAATLWLPQGARPRPRIQSPIEAVVDAHAAGTPAGARTSLPWGFLIGAMLTATAISASSSMVPLYLASLGRSRFAIGGLWALAAALELPAMWLTGILSDRVGRVPLLALGGLAITLLQGMYAAAARWGWLVVAAQFMRALGFASYTANSMTFTADLSTESNRSANSSLYNVAQSVGQLVGLALGGTLVQALGFTAMFALCAAVSAAGVVTFLMLRKFEVKRRDLPQPA